MRHVVAGGDALVLAPTGGGKSICFQVPALCRPGTAVVVSPLIALMDDQVAALRQLGVSAGALHSDLDPAEARSVTRDLIEQQLDLLYVSPERLLANGTLERLSRLQLALFAIDEAHCVSQWGHEFRPEYRGLACLADQFPTAAAHCTDRDSRSAHARGHPARAEDADGGDVRRQLPSTESARHRRREGWRDRTASDLLARHSGVCGIVYCATRAKTERVAGRLTEKGIPAIAFHAGLDAETKRAALARFRSGEAVVVVATIAFGMGIDRPDVRFVVHLDMPDSPEAYYQQIGRAGRDGDPAETLLLYGGQDIAQARHWLAQSAAPEAQKRVMRTKLEEMIALTEAATCRTRSLLACFGEELTEPCGHCDNCAAPPRMMRRDGGGAEGAVGGVSHRPGVRRAAHHRGAARRKTDGVLRHGHDRLPTFGVGAEHAAAVLAGADPAAHRARCAGCGYGGAWRAVPGAGQGAADPARGDARHAARGGQAPHRGAASGASRGCEGCRTRGAEPVRGAACLARGRGEGAAHSALCDLPRHGAARYCGGAARRASRSSVRSRAWEHRSCSATERPCWIFS